MVSMPCLSLQEICPVHKIKFVRHRGIAAVIVLYLRADFYNVAAAAGGTNTKLSRCKFTLKSEKGPNFHSFMLIFLCELSKITNMQQLSFKISFNAFLSSQFAHFFSQKFVN